MRSPCSTNTRVFLRLEEQGYRHLKISFHYSSRVTRKGLMSRTKSSALKKMIKVARADELRSKKISSWKVPSFAASTT